VRKAMMLAAMIAMLALAALPAMAADLDFDDDDDHGGLFFDDHDNHNFDNHDDFDNHDFDVFGFGDFEQETEETGDVDLSLEVASTGNNSNQCVAPLQFGNTGNNQNLQAFEQLDSEADDIEFEGSSFEFAPEQSVECTQSVEQAAAASG
jgi:hypothetical protein